MQATCEHGPGSPSIEYVDGWTVRHSNSVGRDVMGLAHWQVLGDVNGDAQALCVNTCDGLGSFADEYRLVVFDIIPFRPSTCLTVMALSCFTLFWGGLALPPFFPAPFPRPCLERASKIGYHAPSTLHLKVIAWESIGLFGSGSRVHGTASPLSQPALMFFRIAHLLWI